MRAHDSYLTTLLNQSNAIFNIPVYQRNYDWDIVNCQQLFNDIETIAYTGKDHFIGSIVYISLGTATVPEYNIIDGQQRITSVLLLLKALYDTVKDEKLKKVIKYSFLVNRDFDDETKIKLKQIESDSGVFEKIIMLDAVDEKHFTEKEKNSNVYRNYVEFKRCLEMTDVSEEDIYNAIFKLGIIDVCLTSEDPQEVFESMNSTGKSLTNTDLLRNYLLMNLASDLQNRLYKQYWLQIEKTINPSSMEWFMVYYLIVKRKTNSITLNKKKNNINRTTLYDAYKIHYPAEQKSNEATESLLKDMLKFAPYYRRLFKQEDIKTDLDKAFYELMYKLNGDAAAIFLMYLMDIGTSDDDLLNATNACISYALRQRVYKGKTVSPQFFGYVIQYFERGDESLDFMGRVWNALISGKGTYAFPDNSQFEEIFRNKNMYLELKPQMVRYILYKFESDLTKEVVIEDNATIEHILPQNTTKWQKYLLSMRDNEYNDYINKIGNLTLTKYNSEISNEPFDDKKEFYEQSGYKLTREIAKKEVWNTNEIKNRSSEMAKKALELWPLPVVIDQSNEQYEYNVMDDNTEELFEELRLSIKELYPFTTEKSQKQYLNILKGERPIMSMIPLQSYFNVTFCAEVDKFTDQSKLEDISGKSHWGIGYSRYSVTNEDDLWKVLEYLQEMIDKDLI